MPAQRVYLDVLQGKDIFVVNLAFLKLRRLSVILERVSVENYFDVPVVRSPVFIQIRVYEFTAPYRGELHGTPYSSHKI